MKNTKRIIAIIIILIMTLTFLAACKTEEEPEQTPPPVSTPEETPEPTPEPEPQVLNVGSSQFLGQFNPFFASNVPDRDVTDLTHLKLIYNDRAGGLILNGIEGETLSYGGTDYTYYGPANISIDQKADGTADYNIMLREDLMFSDGTPLTADDLIFSIYVLLDSDNDGTAALRSSAIKGLANYRTGLNMDIFDKYDEMARSIYEAGQDNHNFSGWTEEQQNTFWVDLLSIYGAAFTLDIIEYCVEYINAFSAEYDMVFSDPVAFSMYLWGYGEPDEELIDAGDPDDESDDIYEPAGTFTTYVTETTYNLAAGETPSVDDFWGEMFLLYEDDLVSLSDIESVGMDLLSELILAFIYAEGQKDPEFAGEVTSIEGVKKTGDYSVTVTTDYFDVKTIYNLCIDIAPLHYYGDADLYDYDNNMFGFTKGDLSAVREKSTFPMGAGPYKFVSYQNGIVLLEANGLYYKGMPEIRYINLIETPDEEKLAGLVTGTFDITEPGFSVELFEYIKTYNSNGELTGDIIAASTVYDMGYGYIGISAENVNVGGDPGGDRSMHLRTALAAVLAACRGEANENYYREGAETIQYPISGTSWAAPRPGDDGYRQAFSRDIDGNEIYAPDMETQEKYDAAVQAAIGFLKEAGYTWDEEEGMFTAAPNRARLEYEIIVHAYGNGGHPAYSLLTSAKNMLAAIGITLNINDIAEANDFWDMLDAGVADIWCDARQADADPDMHQIYHSSNIPGRGGTNDNRFGIDDPWLDELIEEARMSSNRAQRKELYRHCFDIVMQWAVEIPNYQRLNAVLFSPVRVNMETAAPDITASYGWANEIHLMEMN